MSAAPRVDVGILTIKDEEFDAVLKEFTEGSDLHVSPTTHRHYNLRTTSAGNDGSYRVAVMRQPEQGNGEAQAAARDMLEDLSPELILVVGIAGGMPNTDFTLGDVILSLRINDYSVEARQEGRDTTYAMGGGPVERRIQNHVANLRARLRDLGNWAARLPEQPPVVLDDANFYGPPDWRTSVRESLSYHLQQNAGDRPRFRSGVIASSDRLLKETELPIQWLQTQRNLLAVEMESGGVYHAVRDRCAMLAIRGLSDIVGFKRDERWTRYACTSAAAFARAYLRTTPIPPSKTSSVIAPHESSGSSSGPTHRAKDTQSPAREAFSRMVERIVPQGHEGILSACLDVPDRFMPSLMPIVEGLPLGNGWRNYILAKTWQEVARLAGREEFADWVSLSDEQELQLFHAPTIIDANVPKEAVLLKSDIGIEVVVDTLIHEASDSGCAVLPKELRRLWENCWDLHLSSQGKRASQIWTPQSEWWPGTGVKVDDSGKVLRNWSSKWRGFKQARHEAQVWRSVAGRLQPATLKGILHSQLIAALLDSYLQDIVAPQGRGPELDINVSASSVAWALRVTDSVRRQTWYRDLFLFAAPESGVPKKVAELILHDYSSRQGPQESFTPIDKLQEIRVSRAKACGYDDPEAVIKRLDDLARDREHPWADFLKQQTISVAKEERSSSGTSGATTIHNNAPIGQQINNLGSATFHLGTLPIPPEPNSRDKK